MTILGPVGRLGRFGHSPPRWARRRVRNDLACLQAELKVSRGFTSPALNRAGSWEFVECTLQFHNTKQAIVFSLPSWEPTTPNFHDLLTDQPDVFQMIMAGIIQGFLARNRPGSWASGVFFSESLAVAQTPRLRAGGILESHRATFQHAGPRAAQKQASGPSLEPHHMYL